MMISTPCLDFLNSIYLLYKNEESESMRECKMRKSNRFTRIFLYHGKIDTITPSDNERDRSMRECIWNIWLKRKGGKIFSSLIAEKYWIFRFLDILYDSFGFFLHNYMWMDWFFRSNFFNSYCFRKTFLIFFDRLSEMIPWIRNSNKCDHKGVDFTFLKLYKKTLTSQVIFLEYPHLCHLSSVGRASVL